MFIKTHIKSLWPTIGPDSQKLIRQLASLQATRDLLNAIYLGLNWRGRNTFFRRFARVFREPEIRTAPSGVWRLRFAGHSFKMPLFSESMWLDWESAIAILGNDTELKQTYANLLRTTPKPKLFLDVGANYGTHSLLFLVAGVRAVAVEPNSQCHKRFHQFCASNHVQGEMLDLALGEKKSEVQLVYPENETWLGSTLDEVAKKLFAEFPANTKTITVSQTTLDHLVQEKDLPPDVIKIDVEGGELSVLEGGIQTLQKVKPILFFESWPGPKRSPVFALLNKTGYQIFSLPYDPNRLSNTLTAETFAKDKAINHVAVSRY